MPPAVIAAARVLRALAWIALAVPAGLLVYTFPLGFALLLFGGALIVAPPIALGIVGLRLAKSLESGRRRGAALAFGTVQGLALLALSLHATTWDPRDAGEATFYRLAWYLFALAGAASLSVPVLLTWGAGPAERWRPAEGAPRVRLWPWLTAAAFVLLVALSTGWTVSGEHRDERPAGSAQSFVGHLRQREASSGGSRPFDSLTDLLGNVSYRAPGRPPAPFTDAVVVATVTAVDPGLGFYAGGEEETTRMTGYGDPGAEWRTVHATLEVTRLVSGNAPARVVAGFAVGTDLSAERIERDLRSYGRVLLLLQREHPVFDYDPSIYGTVLDGALLGVVDEEGRIELPVLSEQEETELLRSAATVEALRAAAEGPPRAVRLHADGSVAGEEP